MLRISLAILTSILVFSCSKNNKLSIKEYVGFVNDSENGYINERKFNGVKYKSTLLTPEMIVIRSASDINSSQESFKNEVKEQGGNLNFVLTISDEKGFSTVKKTVFNKEKYTQILRYSNSIISDDFKLLKGKDTLYCALVHLEPANSIHPVLKLTVAFTGIDTSSKSDFTLLFNDRIFMNGPLKFYYDKKIFTNKPEIVL